MFLLSDCQYHKGTALYGQCGVYQKKKIVFFNFKKGVWGGGRGGIPTRLPAL